MPLQTVEDFKRIFARHQVDTIYIKHLATKQDNDKNPIYLGKGLTILNALSRKD